MRFCRVRDVKAPTRGTNKSGGVDFYVPNFDDGVDLTLRPRTDMLIPSGIKVEIPKGYMLMGANKSGVATSKQACIMSGREPNPNALESIVILGAEIVDEDYQGEIFIHLVNVGRRIVHIQRGMKIAQFILVPVSYDALEEVPETELFRDSSERGGGALGSTGSY